MHPHNTPEKSKEARSRDGIVAELTRALSGVEKGDAS